MSDDKRNENNAQVTEGHKIGDKTIPLAWQPVVDRTGEPPRGGESDNSSTKSNK